jgi:hypothetical protein
VSRRFGKSHAVNREFAVSDVRLLPPPPCGLSFGIADLVLLQGWAEAQSLQMRVQLDPAVNEEEYEEVLAFSPAGSTVCQWIMWRNEQAVFVQPLIGRRQHYGSVAEALEALTPAEAETLTDIQATHWPS